MNICLSVSVYFIQNRPHPPWIRSVCSFKTCHEVNLLEKLGFQSVTGCLRRNALDQEVWKGAYLEEYSMLSHVPPNHVSKWNFTYITIIIEIPTSIAIVNPDRYLDENLKQLGTILRRICFHTQRRSIEFFKEYFLNFE